MIEEFIMDIFQEITTLREQLQYHNRKYYDEDAPEISDYDYDMMQRKLRTLEAAHPEFVTPESPTQRVGGHASDKFSKVVHAYPCLLYTSRPLYPEAAKKSKKPLDIFKSIRRDWFVWISVHRPVALPIVCCSGVRSRYIRLT